MGQQTLSERSLTSTLTEGVCSLSRLLFLLLVLLSLIKYRKCRSIIASFYLNPICLADTIISLKTKFHNSALINEDFEYLRKEEGAGKVGPLKFFIIKSY